MFLPNPGILAAGVSGGAPVGQKLFTTNGSFTVPAGVTSICGVVIGRGGPGGAQLEFDNGWSGGGGGLAYSNNISVSPGEVLTINISSSSSRILRGSTAILHAAAAQIDGANAGNGVVGDVLRRGSIGVLSFVVGAKRGGGAAGYTSDGISGLPSSKGGGGTSPFGGGAGAEAGTSPNLNGVNYGGGAGYDYLGGTDVALGTPGAGCARIIWGPDRAFPNTNTGDMAA